MRLFKSRNKFFFRNLVVGLIFFGLSFQTLAVPQIYAQSQPKPATTSAIPQKTITVTPTGTPEQYKVALPNGTTETGRVLFCLDPTGLTCGIGDAIGGLADKILGAFKNAIGFVVKKIIVQGLLLVANLFGFAFDKISGACSSVLQGVGDYLSDSSAPAPSMAAVNKFNAFILLDHGVNGIYTGFPKSNSVQNVAQVFQNNVLGIGTAHAQGVGTQDLGDGIREVWSKMRDLAIIFMVVALVIIGFMVMLRRRLDPKTVVTATNALPKFAIALVLIVFSFAIAGFFIDFIHLTVGLVRDYFGGIMGGTFTAFSKQFGGELVWFPIFTAFSFGTVLNWGQLLCTVGLIPFGGGPLMILILVLLVEVLIRLVLIIVGIYLFWILLKNFAYMVLYTIFAPLFFLLGAIPGYESMMVNWFKRMFVNSIAFPIILFLIYLAVGLILSSNPVGQVVKGSVQAPPPIGSNILNIPYLIGLGIIFFATKVPLFLEKMFKVDSFDVKGGMGPGVLAAPIAVPLGAAKTAGSIGKSVKGIQDLGNTTGTWGNAASRALFRGGYQRGMPQPVTNEAGEVTHYEAEAGVRKEGFRAGLARAAGGIIPGPLRASDVKAGEPIRISHGERRAAILGEMDAARKAKRDINYGSLSHRVGEVTPADVDRIRVEENLKPIDTSIAQTHNASPPTLTPEEEKETADDIDSPDRSIR